MSMITFKDGLTIGGNSPIRINCNVGCNNISDIESEISKLKFIQSCNELPDMMMDLSLIELNCTPKVRKTFGVQFILAQPLLIQKKRKIGLKAIKIIGNENACCNPP